MEIHRCSSRTSEPASSRTPAVTGSIRATRGVRSGAAATTPIRLPSGATQGLNDVYGTAPGQDGPPPRRPGKPSPVGARPREGVEVPPGGDDAGLGARQRRHRHELLDPPSGLVPLTDADKKALGRDAHVREPPVAAHR